MTVAMLTAALLTLATPFPPQDGAPHEPIEVVEVEEPSWDVWIQPAWEVGDTHTFELEKSRSWQDSGGRARMHLEVLAEDGDGYLMSWTYGALSVEPASGGPASPTLEAVLALVEGAALEVRTDALGMPVELVNEAEVMRLAEESIDTMIEPGLLERAYSPAQVAEFEAQMERMIRGGYLTSSTLNEAAMVVFAIGLRLRRGEVEEFDASMPSPFGGPPVAAVGRITLDAFDPEERRAVIGVRTEVDGETFREGMFLMMVRAARAAGRPSPEIEELPLMTARNVVTYTYDLDRALPLVVEAVKTIDVDGDDEQRVERQTYRLIDDER